MQLLQPPPQTDCQFQPAENHPAGSWYDTSQAHILVCLGCKYQICVFCANYYTNDPHHCLYCDSKILMQTNQLLTADDLKKMNSYPEISLCITCKTEYPITYPRTHNCQEINI